MHANTKVFVFIAGEKQEKNTTSLKPKDGVKKKAKKAE